MADIRTEQSTPDTHSLADYRALDSSVSGRTQSNTGSNELSSDAASDQSSLKRRQSDDSHQSSSTLDEGIQMVKQPSQSQNDADEIEVEAAEESPLLLTKKKGDATTHPTFFKNNKPLNPRFTTQTVNVGDGNAETNFGGVAGPSQPLLAGPSQPLAPIAEQSSDKTDNSSATIETPVSTNSATLTDTSNTSNRARIVRIIVIAICSFVAAVLALSLCAFFCGKIHGSNDPSTNELKEHSSRTAVVKSNATDHIANMTDICLDWAMNATTNTTGQYNMTNIDWGRCANVTANITTSRSSANLAATNASETTTGSIED
ncbi:uncharacterized protein LOC119075725 isoform X2 [Bradysia coprophila]|uniref:uncharacterized protein LOC119075725 isoform X2 n=1 Tax=Bradysia coprophila TaxID=38358 RepID=UPI00187D7029|nr:uncharacterized protein LOC119075725 isoform X2 [Bradysia coprophila]